MLFRKVLVQLALDFLLLFYYNTHSSNEVHVYSIELKFSLDIFLKHIGNHGLDNQNGKQNLQQKMVVNFIRTH